MMITKPALASILSMGGPLRSSYLSLKHDFFTHYRLKQTFAQNFPLALWADNFIKRHSKTEAVRRRLPDPACPKRLFLMMVQEPEYSLIVLIARVLLTMVFLVSGIHKTWWYAKAVEEFKQASVPLIPVSLPLTIVLHIIASLCIISGVFVEGAAVLLALFTLVTTLWVFRFWNKTGLERLQQSRAAITNLGLIGGLLLLVATGSGQYVI